MIRSRPLRFLAVVLGGWAAIRAAMLGPAWWSAPAATAASNPPKRLLAARPPFRAAGAVGPRAIREFTPPRRPAAEEAKRRAPASVVTSAGAGEEGPARSARPPAAAAALSTLPSPPPTRAVRPSRPGRSSVYGWAFLRSGGAPALAPGGTLGGSQAGLRAAYRLNRDSSRPVALAARLASPLGRSDSAEAALGVEWRPSRRVPVSLLAERRQKLGSAGRSAFALMVHGGLSEARLGLVRIDAFAQAGIVGARSRDLFADGALRVSVPVGVRVRLGAGAWGAAQPGIARLDLGPQASLRLPLGDGSVTLAADWRLRVAGKARPGSGPALTLATDF